MSAVKFQTMPPLAPEEYAQLEASCVEHGIQVPIIVDEDGVVIDGHHRQKIAQEHGLFLPTETRDYLTVEQKRTLSISLNIDRRQLTREQRRAIIAELIEAAPQKSDREHARAVGASHNTVAAVRADLEQRGQVDHVSERVDSLGRQQPAAKSPVKVTETHKEEMWVDPGTGEVVDESKPMILPPMPRPEKPQKVLNAEQRAAALGQALYTLASTSSPEGRQVLTDAWALGAEGCTPTLREYITPTWFRAVARGLNALANNWEA